MEYKMSLLQEYNAIMDRYRNGEFGNGNLHLNEILRMAGNSDLLDGLSESEIRRMIKNHHNKDIEK